MQYAVKDGAVLVIEANPRASRTVPFVSKATGVPLAKVASRIMVGATLAELREEGLRPAAGRGWPRVGEGGGAAVQQVPRGRHDPRPGDALHRRGHGHRPLVRAGVREEPGRGGEPAARRPGPCSSRSRTGTRPSVWPRPAGSPSWASASSPPPAPRRPCEAEGIPIESVVAKIGETTGMDAVDLISSGKVDLVVNTPRGQGPRADGNHIRRAAVAHKVPCLTTAAAALAAAAGIAEIDEPRGDGAVAAGVPRRRPAAARGLTVEMQVAR